MDITQLIAEWSPAIYGFGRRLKRKFKYSQFGEDEFVIDHFLIGQLARWNYVDIGSAHPIIGSNTYLLYRNGAWGYTIDANPYLVKKHRKLRPRDFQIQAAVGSSDKSVDFDIYENWAFSRRAKCRIPVPGVNRISTRQIAFQSILEKVDFRNNWLLNIDVEGEEIEILDSANFEVNKPTVALIEITRQSSATIEKIMKSWNFTSPKTLGMTRIYIDENKLRVNEHYDYY
jgi:hypothetical protein